METKIHKIRRKLKHKKLVLKQVKDNHKKTVTNFFQACGIRLVNF